MKGCVIEMAVVRKVKLQGIKNVSYTRKDGQTINGYELHFAYSDPDINGVGAGSLFARSVDMGAIPKVGDMLRVYHDDFARRFTLIPDGD